MARAKRPAPPKRRDPSDVTGAEIAEMVDKRLDALSPGWANAFTGLATGRDKTTFLRPTGAAPIPDEEKNAMFQGDPLCRKLCSKRAEDMLRRGFKVEVEPEDDEYDGEEYDEADGDPDAEEDVDRADEEPGGGGKISDAREAEDAINAYLEEMQVKKRVKQGLIWGATFGGAGGFLGALDGRPLDTPLDEDRIRDFRSITVLDKRALYASDYDSEAISPYYGDPEFYRIVPEAGAADAKIYNFDIHRSRFILFDGMLTPRRERRLNQGWDWGVLDGVFQVVQAFANAWLSVSHLLGDASQAVYEVTNLAGIVASKNRSKLTQRMEIIDFCRSVLRAVMIEKDKETFHREATSFTGIPEVLDRFCMLVAAVAPGDMPQTILFGRSPAGMNATGESDQEIWNASLAAGQEQEVEPILRRIVRLAFRAKNGPTGGIEPKRWKICFPPLRMPTEKERSEIWLSRAQEAKTLVDAQIVMPEEAALSLPKDSWIKIDRELRQKSLDMAKKRPELLVPRPGMPGVPTPGVGPDGKPLPPGQDSPPQDGTKKPPAGD